MTVWRVYVMLKTMLELWSLYFIFKETVIFWKCLTSRLPLGHFGPKRLFHALYRISKNVSSERFFKPLFKNKSYRICFWIPFSFSFRNNYDIFSPIASKRVFKLYYSKIPFPLTPSKTITTNPTITTTKKHIQQTNWNYIVKIPI